MEYETILVDRQERILIITLNRPDKLNSVNSRLWMEVGTALKEFSENPELWVAILTGAGDRAFCAGADLKEIASGGFSVTDEMRDLGFAGIVRNHIPKPIIAAVNGFALGGGTEIAISCDLVVASEKATFGLPEVKRGLIAGAGGLLRLPRQIPVKVAMKAILTGNSLSAEEAKQWGLINEVVPHDQVLPAAIKLAEEIASNAPVAVNASKEIVYRGLDANLSFPPEAWAINDRYTATVFSSDDAKEGPRAFAEKRKPNWAGK
ncbi:crotonase/enoyl-CoA hydratase family protein [Mesobacillus harenae]|uniref:crotonase/enoyl-CoA hydratase family protein n=1 Tax=Mesobacillus harenae TaxID=2213203 RepID=UPI001580E9DC